AQLKKVTALLLIPASPNHKDRLEKIRRIGTPAENPKNSMIKARRSKNAVNADFQPVVCVVIALLFSAEKPIAAIQSCNSVSFNKTHIFFSFQVFYFLAKATCWLEFFK